MNHQVVVKARGSREEVWAGTARRTSGGLTKADLMLNKRGKIVSRRQSEAAVDRYPALKAKLCATPIEYKAPEVKPPTLTDGDIDALLDFEAPPAPIVVAPPQLREAPLVEHRPMAKAVAPPQLREAPHNPLLLIRAAVEAHIGFGPSTPNLRSEQKRLYAGVFNDIRAQVEIRQARYGESLHEAIANADYAGAVRKWMR